MPTTPLRLALLAGLMLTGLSAHAQAQAPSKSLYLDGGGSEIAVILAHGRGKNPDWKVVRPLRVGIHEQLGYHTLSLQMPNDQPDFESYATVFPQAYQAIEQAIRFLREEKGVKQIYLFGHSMGSRMMSAFLANHPDTGVSGLVVAGCRNGGAEPLSCGNNLRQLSLPVLDIWGVEDNKDNEAARQRQDMVSDRYQQAGIANANHRFDGHEMEMTEIVADWLRKKQSH